MQQLVTQLHFYNMLLVMAAGSITGIWGLVLYFRHRRTIPANAKQNVGAPPAGALQGSNEPGDVRPKTAEATRNVGAPPAGALQGSNEPGDVRPAKGAPLAGALQRPWRIALTVTAILGALQALFGITLVLLGQKPPGGSLYYLHYVYGAIVALAIPAAVSYATGGKDVRRDTLIFSIAALILVAAGARALMTGLGLP